MVIYQIADISGKDTLPKEGEFRPYKVTLEIQSNEDSKALHDKIAISIPNGAHKFIGEISNRCLPNHISIGLYKVKTNGTIDIVPSTGEED